MNALKTFTCNTFFFGWLATAVSGPLVQFNVPTLDAIGAIGFGFGVTLVAFSAIGALILGARAAVTE